MKIRKPPPVFEVFTCRNLHVFVSKCSPPQNKPISIIVNQVFSKYDNGLSSILNIKQKNRRKVLHRKPKLGTCSCQIVQELSMDGLFF